MINKKRDMLMKINWIQKIDTTVIKEEMKFNVTENEILK